jgi:hypothetical protein
VVTPVKIVFRVHAKFVAKNNPLLHIQQKPTALIQSEDVVVNNVCKTRDMSGLLSTAIVYIYDKHNQPHTCRVLLDSDSQRCFIKTSLCKRLGLRLKSSNISVVGINLSVNNIVHEANIKIKSCTTSFSLNIQSLVSNNITQKLPVSEFPISQISIPPNIKLADPTGRFIVRLPFRRNPPELGSSKEIALKRFITLERKFKRNQSLHADYNAFIQEYKQLGHLEHVPFVEAQNLHNYNSYYLAHHAVFKNSLTSSIRVVFDGSCPSSNGKSLNDNLYVGPALQQDLFSILVRFRTHQFVISGDIAKMYRQILVHPDDQNYQLILWRDKPNLPIETFRLKTVTYGLGPSPFLAIRCINELASINMEHFPITSKILLRDFYVDDVLTGADSLETALQIRKELTTILQQAGFELRKFASNNITLLPSNNSSDKFTSLDMQTQNKTLGVIWEHNTDNIKYSVDPGQLTSHKFTKRNILSIIAKLFDPLGLVGPVTVVAKIILQEVWASKIDWDDSLPSTILSKWSTFLQNFITLNSLTVPHKVINNTFYIRAELHGFSDSSAIYCVQKTKLHL